MRIRKVTKKGAEFICDTKGRNESFLEINTGDTNEVCLYRSEARMLYAMLKKVFAK